MTDLLPSTLFGISRGLDSSELAELEDFLRHAWEAQHDRPPSSLSADLDRLRDVFKTGASGKRIRDVVGALSKVPRRPPTVSDEVFVVIDERRGLVTPEGRVMLEELTRMRDLGEQVLTRDAMLRATARVADAYGGWQRDWLRQQLGSTSLRPGTYGVVLLLLLNGSTSRDRALRLPADEEQERALARAVIPVIDAFATRLGGKPMSDREAARLRSNWRVTEARRHLFQRVRVEDEEGDAYLWIDDEEETLRLLAERLAARQDVDVDVLKDALETAAAAYMSSRPTLAAWGVAHDRTNHTRHVLSRLESHFLTQRTSP
jgi:hypothetical protein